jgi:ethanolamine utilization protein EutN
MRIAKIIGKVVLSKSHPTFDNANLRLAYPLTLENLDGTSNAEADTIVVWDELGAGDGSLIGLAEGPEAAQPFRPEMKPVDAYAAAILDSIDLHNPSVESIKQAADNN